MIKIDIIRRPTRNNYFVGYILKVNLDGKEYDLNVDFLIWAEVRPNEETKFVLRPEAVPGSFHEPKTPVYKEEILPGMFQEKWKEGIKEVKHCIDTISFPLNSIDNAELFTYCFNDPVTFSPVYEERLQELAAYAEKNNQQIMSAPEWSEIDSKSLVPIAKVPQEADGFFKHVFKLRLESAGYEICD